MMKFLKEKGLIVLMFSMILTTLIAIGISPVKTVKAVVDDFVLQDNMAFYEGYWNIDGDTVVAKNPNPWDVFAMTNVYASKEQSVYIKADITYQSGWGSGLVFGVPNSQTAWEQFYTFNLWNDPTGPYVRFFSTNVDGGINDSHDYKYYLTQEEVTKGVYSLEIRIDNGIMRGYLNGKCVAMVENAPYNGGYLGLMSWLSNVTFSNVDLKVTTPTVEGGNEVDDDGYTHLNPMANMVANWGRWTGDSKQVIASNHDGGNLFAMSNIFVGDDQDLIYEADLTRLANTDGAMLVFGVDNPHDPGAGWFAVNLRYNIDGVYSCLFSENKGTLGFAVDNRHLKLDASSAMLKTHKLRVEAYASGRIVVSLDGVIFSDTYDHDYHGGYIGFGTWFGNYIFDNIRYKIVDTSNTKYTSNGEVMYNALEYRSSWRWGDWLYSSNSLSITHYEWYNTFTMSNLYVEKGQNFIFEADVESVGNSASLAFGMPRIYDPSFSWYGLALGKDDGVARIFHEKNDNGWTCDTLGSINLTESQKNSAKNKLRLEISADGRIKTWIDGVLICDVVDAEWNGGYIGFNAFHTSVTFSNVKYGITNPNPSNEVKELFTKFYNNGVYTKNTNINLNSDAQRELLKYFHACVNILERTTYYVGNELWMSRDDGKYSYYGSNAGLTHGTATEVMVTPSNAKVAIKGTSMEDYYTTLFDLMNSNAVWSKIGNVYETNDEQIIKYFLDFTAPCFLNFTEENVNYFIFDKVTVETIGDQLILKLYVSNLNSGALSVNDLVLSQAVITLPTA